MMVSVHVYIFILTDRSSALRSEWAKARARAARWKEEVILLNEEMRRVLAFCDHQAARWNLLAGHRQQECQDLLQSGHDVANPVSPELDDGLRAYAAEHAAMECSFKADFALKWDAIRRLAATPLDDEDDGINEVITAIVQVTIDDDDDNILDAEE